MKMTLRPGLSFKRVEHALGGGGEVGGLLRHVFLVHDHRAGALHRRLERGDAVMAEGIVLGQRGDVEVGVGLQACACACMSIDELREVLKT